MAKRAHTIREVTPPETDDLQVIHGIGPAVEHRLHGVGIFTFIQLAALSPADIAATVADLTGLTAERVIRQNWIGQARHLATVSGVTKAHDEPAPIPHDVSVSPEVLVNEETVIAEDEPVNAVVDEETVIYEDAPVNTQEPEGAYVETLPPSMPTPALTGTFHMREMEIIGGTSIGSHRILHYDEPFDIRLTLDLSELQVPDSAPLHYKASVYSKGLGSSGYIVGEAEGTVMAADTVDITIERNTLANGIYRLAATVILGLPTMKLTLRPGTMAVIDGGQVQVF